MCRIKKRSLLNLLKRTVRYPVKESVVSTPHMPVTGIHSSAMYIRMSVVGNINVMASSDGAPSPVVRTKNRKPKFQV